MLIKKSQLQKIIIEEVQNTINEISKRRVRFKKRRQAALLSDPERGKYGLGGSGVNVEDIQDALAMVNSNKYVPIMAGTRSLQDVEDDSWKDGKYGRRTYNAIRAFQKDFPPDDASGADGLVGAFTAAKIIEQAPNSEFAQKLSQKGFVSNMTDAGHSIVAQGRDRSDGTPVAGTDASTSVSPEDGKIAYGARPAEPDPEYVTNEPGVAFNKEKMDILQTTSTGVKKGTYSTMAIEAPQDLENLLQQLSDYIRTQKAELANETGLPKGASAKRINAYLKTMVKAYETDVALEPRPGGVFPADVEDVDATTAKALEQSKRMLQKIRSYQTAIAKAEQLMFQVRKEKIKGIREKLDKQDWIQDIFQRMGQNKHQDVEAANTRYRNILRIYARSRPGNYKTMFESKKKIKIKLVESNQQLENTEVQGNERTFSRLRKGSKRPNKKQVISRSLQADMTWPEVLDYIEFAKMPKKKPYKSH